MFRILWTICDGFGFQHIPGYAIIKEVERLARFD